MKSKFFCFNSHAVKIASSIFVFSFFFGNSIASWDPDPDSDGIPTTSDLCPRIYDPQQSDTDNDGIGDYCDPDYARPALNSKITDLRIEHITPYGAWLHFTAPYNTDFWGWYATAAWSKNPDELKTLEGFNNAANRGDSLNIGRIHASYGEKNLYPIILTQLTPNTTYYVAVTRGRASDGYDPRISNIVSFKTTQISLPQPLAAHPRVYVTPTYIQQLKARRANKDAGWVKWEDAIRARTNVAVAENDAGFCFDAALLYLVTGSGQDRTKAISLLNDGISYWENNTLRNNQFRWANARLGVCVDLLWNDIDAALRNRAISAFLDDDEYNITERDLRLGDTDEYASFPRNWIVDGLVACNASGIEPSLSERACKVLETGHRLWHGVQLVKARRDRGMYAQSGGFKPDGTSYGQGTQLYWLETFLALANAGESLEPYGPYIQNSLLSMFIHLLTPTQKGYATIGDIEAYTNNFDIEPNSYQLRRANGGVLGLFSGVLSKAGRNQAAGWAKFLGSRLFNPTQFKADGNSIYRLLFESDSIPARNYSGSLDTFFHAEGFGVVFDRTSWKENASYLTFRAGWNRVDHVHADVGHFQFFRNGKWLTHESIAYDGEASCLGHNIWVMKINGDSNGACPNSFGQNYYGQSDNTKSLILRTSSGTTYTYVTAEMAGAYNTFMETDIRNFESIQRSLLWLKDISGNDIDTLLVFDRIQTTPEAESNAIGYSQYHVDAEPTIDGTQAKIALGDQQLIVDVVTPTSATISNIQPAGGPGGNGDHAIYTHRLKISPGKGKGFVNSLTVLRGSRSGLKLEQPVPVSNDLLQGAFVQGTLVLVPKSQIQEKEASLTSTTIDVPTTQPIKLLVAGLEPEAGYTLNAVQQGSKLILTLGEHGNIKTDKGGILGVYINSSRKILPLDIASNLFSSSFEANDN